MPSLIHALLVCLAAGQDHSEAPAPPAPLTLREALDQTGRISPEILLARLRWLEARAQTVAVKSEYKPQLVAGASTAYQTINLQGIGLFIPGLGGRTGPFRTFNARPTLSQTALDLSLLSRIRSSRERETGRKFDLETAREAAMLAVIQIYLQTGQAESRMRAAQARVDAARALWKQTADFVEAGTASKLDLARAAQRLHAEQATVAQALQARDELTVLLLRAIGLPPGRKTVLASVDELAAPPEASASAAIARRPEIRSIGATLRASQHDYAAALRQRLPRLGFSGDYGVSGAGPDRSLSTYTAGATLTIPLWTSGRIQGEAEAARLRIEQARARQRLQELRIAQEVEQARIAVASSEQSLRFLDQAAGAAKEALELSRLRFGAGIATSVDTAVAQAALAEAEDAAIAGRYELQIARVRLCHALGNVRQCAGD